jgi:hypothetical protein
MESLPDGVTVSSAKNSWTDFAVQLNLSQLPAHPVLQLPQFNGVMAAAYQVLPVRMDQGDAGYIRRTGEQGRVRDVPRVLLPLPAKAGTVDLSLLKGSQEGSAQGSEEGSALIWVELNITPQAQAGKYAAVCALLDAQTSESAAAVAIHLSVEDLTLPTERHLHFSGPLQWSSLLQWYPDAFEPVTPRLLDRSDPRFATTVAILDQYMQLAHENGTDFFIPRLQPIVKWPLAKMPEVDWTSFDSVASDWLTGKAFADNTPVAFWPLPEPDSLSSFDLTSQLQYWQTAAERFDQMQWLDRSPVVLHDENQPESWPESRSHSGAQSLEPGATATVADSILSSAEAGKILRVYPRLSVMLGLEDDQLQLVSPDNPTAIAPQTTSRLLTVSPGLVHGSPIRDWPGDALPPRHWIDAAAANGSLQMTGPASEQGIRSLAWLAFSRNASLVLCDHPLAIKADDGIATGDPLVWACPGAAFGIDHPLATLQLKWIRQAEQDYEYLLLAAQKGARDDALQMCRLITKPVQLQPDQPRESVFDLLAGTTEPHASEQARQLLVAQLTDPTNPKTRSVASSPASLQMLRWFTDRQRPTVVATGSQWMWNLDPAAGSSTDPGHWITANLDFDLYNPADAMPTGNRLEWTNPPGGWEEHPSPIDVPALSQYQVKKVTTTARFDLDKISTESRQPIQLTFVDGFSGQTVPCRLVVPVAISQRRQQLILLDGSLKDWFPEDAIQLDQPLVRMLNRPALQGQDLQLAEDPASIYTAWSDENFYLAFRLGGVATADLRSTRNFVQYDHGRAWGEDLCELLIQPIYIDNTTGPTLHVVCKPAGNWVEQQQITGGDWQPFEACDIRYASGLDPKQQLWRGEVAIPWKAIAAQGRGRPSLLRFNFIQHQNATGQSASWAGPIDQSRDGKLAGVILLKDP